jgi:hypothetical protein
MNEQSRIAEDTVAFNDKKVEISTYERYKGRKGITDRVGFISKAMLRAWTYYYEGQDGKGTTFRAPTNADTLRTVKSVLGEPTQRFGLLLFHYLTDDTGELIDPEKLRGKVKIWALSESRYTELGALSSKWPILDAGFDGPQHDLMIKCTEEKFQRMTFTPCPNALWKKKQSWYEALKAQEMKAKERLRMALGRELKDSEILDLIGGNRSSPTRSSDTAGEIDLSDIVDDKD